MSNMHQMLLQGLKQLKAEVPAPHMGICDNIDTVMDQLFGTKSHPETWVLPDNLDLYIWVQLTAKRWPKWSGDDHYPVPLPSGMGLEELRAQVYTPMDAYHYYPNLWQGEYGDLRRELLDFLIEELENELR